MVRNEVFIVEHSITTGKPIQAKQKKIRNDRNEREGEVPNSKQARCNKETRNREWKGNVRGCGQNFCAEFFLETRYAPSFSSREVKRAIHVRRRVLVQTEDALVLDGGPDCWIEGLVP